MNFNKTIIKKNCALIVLNGSKPSNNLLKHLNPYLSLKIAANGGVKLINNPLKYFDYIIGDFDSVKENNISDFKTSQILFKPDQNLTDLDKSIVFINEKKIKQVHILGGYGNRLDHIWNNFQILYSALIAGMQIFFWTNNQIIFIVKSNLYIEYFENTNISFFGYPIAKKVSTNGFLYEIKNLTLSIQETGSISNKIINNSAKITIDSGAIIVFLQSNNNINKLLKVQ